VPKDGTVFYYGHMMPIQDIILSGKFTGLFLGKNDGCHFLLNSLLPKKVAWYVILLLAIPILKELSKPIWTPRLLALKTKKKKLEKPTILVCLIYHRVPEEWAGTVMERKMELSPL
jgi:hypothetical protein